LDFIALIANKANKWLPGDFLYSQMVLNISVHQNLWSKENVTKEKTGI